MQLNAKTWRKLVHWFRTSVWAFPAVLLIFLLLLTTLKISGSSIGSYYPVLYGSQAKDPDLLFGSPRPIRSDEWLTTTQLVVMQTKTGFPIENDRLGSGRDLSIQPEVPAKDWSTGFRLHNWSLLILPLEYAFAFKWWFVMLLLIVSCYFFLLRLLPQQKLLSITISTAFGLSPFVLWWYQVSIFMPLTYGFWMLILGLRILNQERLRYVKGMLFTNVLYSLALSFTLISFGMILYPPFLIPIALVVAAFLGGQLLNKLVVDKYGWRKLLLPLGIFGASAVVAMIVGILFVIEHRSMINVISHTIYPGNRLSPSGDLNTLSVFDGFLLPLLQSGYRGGHFFTNQSEASNFILLMPFLILPGLFFQTRTYLMDKKVDFSFAAIQLCALLFLVRAFVPFGDRIYMLLFLNRVPNGRLIIGMGFVGIIQLIFVVRAVAAAKINKISRYKIYLSLYSLGCLAILLLVGHRVISKYPLFLNNYLLMIAFAVLFVSIIVAFLTNKRLLGAGLLLFFTLGSSFYILPIYRGLDFIKDGRVVSAIERVSKPADDWVTVDAVYFENLPLDAGRGNIGGVQLYPDLNFWHALGEGKYESIYNRQAHALFSTNLLSNQDMELVQPNLYKVRFTCNDFIKKNVDYALSVHALSTGCTKLVDTVRYPNTTFFLYEIIK